MTEPITAQRQRGNLQKFPEVGETPKEKRRDRSWQPRRPASEHEGRVGADRKEGWKHSPHIPETGEWAKPRKGRENQPASQLVTFCHC
jgi:hypothetical protein